jgi:predicted SnoaL-like aldol condensation-catalyzing enzyme
MTDAMNQEAQQNEPENQDNPMINESKKTFMDFFNRMENQPL